jgi:RNA polymerase sigma-70 factor (ECF subfamily)
MAKHTVHDPTLQQSVRADNLLIQQVVQRDVTAFTELYDRYAQPIYVMAIYMVGHPEAEEVVQEVFLRLWHKADQFDATRGSFKSWLMSVGRNYMLDQLKRRSHEWRLRQVEQVDRLLSEAKDMNADVVAEVWARERRSIILRALQALPAEQRQAIVLAYFGGLSQSTIARQLDWPLGTVKKRIRLGLQKLRTALRQHEGQAGSGDRSIM